MAHIWSLTWAQGLNRTNLFKSGYTGSQTVPDERPELGCLVKYSVGLKDKRSEGSLKVITLVQSMKILKGINMEILMVTLMKYNW